MSSSCPYQNCPRTNIEPGTLFCPECKKLLSWCCDCNSANHIMGRYCRVCSRPLGQGREWRMYKSNPHLTADAEFEFSYPKDPESFSMIWSANLRTQIEASPIAAYGELVCADKSGNVFFFNQFDGSQPARVSVGECVTYTPATNSIYLCVAAQKTLSFIDLLAGKRVDRRYELQGRDEVFSSHLVTEADSIYLNTFDPTGEEFRVYRFVPGREKPSWRSEAFASKCPPTMPLIVSDYLLVGTHEGNILVLDKEQGRRSAELEESNLIKAGINVGVAPAFLLARAYFFDRLGTLHSAKLTNRHGLRIESFPMGSFDTSFINQFALSSLCMLIGCDEGVINVDTGGSVNWSTKIHDLGIMRTSPVFCGSVALVGGEDGFVYCFDLANKHAVRCERNRDEEKGGKCEKLFVVAANERFFAVSDKGEVRAYTLQGDVSGV